MAVTATRRRSCLVKRCVLSPERYDPRRALSVSDGGVRLGDLVTAVTESVPPGANHERSIVWDTSDVKEGFVVGRKPVTTVVGSTKKRVFPGDVLISRLRPYLRQVAFVDEGVPQADSARLLCSTEFFVLRSPGGRSIAFLAAYLLSEPVQRVLSASQEGGHHPRFDIETLLALPVPTSLVEIREEISQAVEAAIARYRESVTTIATLIENAESHINA